MDKYISVFEPIGDGTRDRGEKQYCLICSKGGIQKGTGFGCSKILEFFPRQDIERVDCYRGDELQNNMASGAAAGLLLGGARGAVIGGMLASGPSNAWWIEIELKDHTVHYFRLYRSSDSKTFFKWANDNGIKVEAAKDEETLGNGTSAADEILKFKQLLDLGAITQEEFDAKKQQLLGL